MEKFIKENYYLHLIVGALIGLILTFTYAGVPIALQYFLSMFITGCFATAWEWFWAMKGNPVDKWDVIWSIIGAVLVLTIKLIF
jgi:hypothetical protein